MAHDMKIGIVGCGVIGEATAYALEQRGHLPYRYDPAKGWTGREAVDVEFICVPTPEVNGRLDTSILEQALQESRAGLKVVRSTVPLGFMEGGVYMPSFMRERFPEEESRPSFRVFGGDTGAVANLFRAEKSLHTDYRTAEFIKLAMNAHLAMQVSFATELSDAAQRFGANWNTVARALKADPRIGEHAYLAPGPFDGKCLPKDTTNLQTQTDSTLLRAVLEVNDAYSHTKIAKEEQYAISQ